jgi:hypothetical protein
MSHEREHPVGQAIDMIAVHVDADNELATYRTGHNGVTLIEACTKSGLHADMPYVRVWKGNVCEAEFCQHNIVGVYFAAPVPVVPAEKPVRYVCPYEDMPGHDFATCNTCGPL